MPRAVSIFRLPATRAVRLWGRTLPVLAAMLVVSGCDLLSGGAQQQAARDALWQAEVDSMQIVVLARAALRADPVAFDEMRRSRDAVEAALAVPAAPEEAMNAAARASWTRVREAVDTLLSHQAAILSAAGARSALDAGIPMITSQLDQAARALVEGAAKGDASALAEQTYLLGRSMALLGRLSRRADEMCSGDTVAISAADGFTRDSKMLGIWLDGALEGNAELGIGKIVNPEAVSALRAAREHYTPLQAQGEILLSSVQAIVEAKEATDQLFGDVLELRHSLERARAPSR